MTTRKGRLLSSPPVISLLLGAYSLLGSPNTAHTGVPKEASQAKPVPANVEKRADIGKLEPGKAIERELAGSESHSYEMALQSGQYFNIVVEQRGIDVVVKVIGPDTKQIFEFNSEIRTQGQETVTVVAEATGNYRLDVQPVDKKAAAGRYEIRVAELRAATEQDRQLQEARKLYDASVQLWRKGQYDAALPLGERALAIREKSLGPDHSYVATSLNILATLYATKGDYAKAEPLYQRALAVREKSLGPDHPSVATSLSNLAGIYSEKGDYAKAELLYQRARAIRENSLGPDHPDVAASLVSLAFLYKAKGDYAKAEPLYLRAQAIRENSLGPDHPDVAYLLNNLANLYSDKGDYAKAEPLYLRAQAIRENSLGPDHPDVAASLNDLASLYKDKGDYAKAEPLYQRALAIREKSLGRDHLYVAYPLNNLANLYLEKGDYAKAEPLYERSLVILEKSLGPDHHSVATVLNGLASLSRDKGDYARAETMYQRALAIREKSLGPDHPDVATSLNNLANLYKGKGDYDKAEPLYQRSLAVWEKSLGPDHPDVAYPLNNLATLYTEKGDYAKAEPLYQRTLAVCEKSLGPDHPNLAASLRDLANFYSDSGKHAKAVEYLSRAVKLSERNIAVNMATGSERQKLLYQDTLYAQTNAVISLHTQSGSDNVPALSLAVATVLQRKGRTLEAMTDIIASLRRRANPQDRELIDELTDARSRVSKLVLGGPGERKLAEYRAEIKKLEERVEELEGSISRHSAEFRAQSLPVTLEAVQAAIPNNAALVEFVPYRPRDPKAKKVDDRYGEVRYVAYLIRNNSEPAWVELGKAGPINSAIAALRRGLRDPHTSDAGRGPRVSTSQHGGIKALARAVDEKVMRPIRRLLGDTRKVLISPDGALNLIPFAALVDEHSRFLAERYTFIYLTGGRDLLRLQTKLESNEPPVLIGNPAYDDDGVTTTSERSATSLVREHRRSGEYPIGAYRTLAGAGHEVDEIARLLPGARTLKQGDATEAALKRLRSPSILHIATHGFFLPDQKAMGDDKSDTMLENPMLRSGLALAGANKQHSGTEDGVLTALEAAGLDLWGTKLVVLSACDTGVGDVRNGDGVYGLRRALVLAGSETQVMSLWAVSDQATRELMVEYYRGLQRGEGRAEALRHVQLSMLRSKERRHPYYWASFIQSGEWANLAGKR